MKKQNKMAKGKKKQVTAPPVQITDLILTLSEDGATLTSTVSPNAQWAGIQRYVDPSTTDGAIAIFEAQRNYSAPPGEGATTGCPVKGTGYYKAWSVDFNYDVHHSNWIFIP